MSQATAFPDMGEVYGSRSKIRYEPYTVNELNSDEYFWNQMKVIIEMKDFQYLYHFLDARSRHLDKQSGM